MKAHFTTTVTMLRCLRCGHEWLPRKATPPKVCPICKRETWHMPPQKTTRRGG